MSTDAEAKQRKCPQRLGLLAGLLIAFVLAPPLLYVLSRYASEQLRPMMLAPIYAQGVYAGFVFRGPSRFFAMGEAGPYPLGVAGWSVTMLFWISVSIVLWAGIRWLRFVTKS